MLIQYGSLAREVEVPGWYPEGDGDAIHSGADLKEADQTFAELRTAYAAHVRAVRKSLKLTQEEAGEIIGGGRRAFHRYERGLAPPSDAAVGLIEILAKDPKAMEILKSLRRNSGNGMMRKTAGRRGERLSA